MKLRKLLKESNLLKEKDNYNQHYRLNYNKIKDHSNDYDIGYSDGKLDGYEKGYDACKWDHYDINKFIKK